MLRKSVAFGLAMGVLAVAVPAMAADYSDELRGPMRDWSSYKIDDYNDPLSFEFGLRYFYSKGQHRMTMSNGDSYSSDDTSHILELHGRIDDHSTATYLEVDAGYAAAIEGTYSTPSSGGTQTIHGGQVAYAGGDFGYLPFGTEAFQVGGLIGYKYRSESPDMGRVGFTTSGGGGDSDPNDLRIHELRLGLAANSSIGGFIDLRATGAVVPYAWLTGTYGAYSGYTPAGTVQGSSGKIDGHLYGAEAELTASVKPYGNLAIQVGGRASYLTGPASIYYERADAAWPGTRQGYTTDTQSLSFLRYGVFAGLAAAF